MSYDLTNAIFARRHRHDITRGESGEDLKRGEFLRRLDEAPFEVKEFEASFLESFLTVSATTAVATAAWWTPRRRNVADEMIQRYRHRL